MEIKIQFKSFGGYAINLGATWGLKALDMARLIDPSISLGGLTTADTWINPTYDLTEEMARRVVAVRPDLYDSSNITVTVPSNGLGTYVRTTLERRGEDSVLRAEPDEHRIIDAWIAAGALNVWDPAVEGEEEAS